MSPPKKRKLFDNDPEEVSTISGGKVRVSATGEIEIIPDKSASEPLEDDLLTFVKKPGKKTRPAPKAKKVAKITNVKKGERKSSTLKQTKDTPAATAVTRAKGHNAAKKRKRDTGKAGS